MMNAVAHPSPANAGTVGSLFGRIAMLRTAMSPSTPEDVLDDLAGEVETLTAKVAATRTQDLLAIRQKIALLHDRLECDLDPCVAGEAVTLALVTSLLVDVTALGT